MININKLYVTHVSSFHQNSSTISVVYHLFELKTQHSIIHNYRLLFFSIIVDTIGKLHMFKLRKIEEKNFSIKNDKISLISVIVKNKRYFSMQFTQHL